MTIETLLNTHPYHVANALRTGARWALGLPVDASDKQINEAREHLTRVWTERDAARRERDEARNLLTLANIERDEARRLHATAVEELARVKMDAPTIDALTIFRVLSDCKSMQYHTISNIRTLAEELAGKLGAS